jgi:hypothetical protein
MEEQLFQIMKFNLYKAAHEPFGLKWISDSYLLAWHLRIYPRCHLHLSWHDPFENCFRLKNVIMSRIESHLRDNWRIRDYTALHFQAFLAAINASTEISVTDRELADALRYFALCDGEYKRETWEIVAQNSRFAPSEFMELPVRIRDFNLDAKPGYGHQWHTGEPEQHLIEGNRYR